MTRDTLTPTRYTALCGAEAASELRDGRVLFSYALTPCCGASGKGNADASTGVVCRACYKEVAANYGATGWQSLRQAARDAKCPNPDQCADHMLAVVMGELY